MLRKTPLFSAFGHRLVWPIVIGLINAPCSARSVTAMLLCNRPHIRLDRVVVSLTTHCGLATRKRRRRHHLCRLSTLE
jgi:hypothetical protein